MTKLPPYRHESDTSRIAAESVKNHEAQVELAYEFIRDRGTYGATGDEIAEYLTEFTGRDVYTNTASARLNQLLTATPPRITKTPMRRNTRAGRPAVVHIAGASWAALLPDHVPPPPPAEARPVGVVLPPCAPPPPSQLAVLRQRLALTGHGHVVPRIDGSKQGCGGVYACKSCRQEKAYFDALAAKESVPC